MSIEEKLKSLGIILPECPKPQANYVLGLVHYGLLYLSGQGPMLKDGSKALGVVGRDFTMQQANFHARRTELVLLSAAQQVLGLLDRVERVLNVYGMVNGSDDFFDRPKGINGCSDLFVEVFGALVRHTRAVVVVGNLPRGFSVEITAIIDVRP